MQSNTPQFESTDSGSDSAKAKRQILSVSELTASIKDKLESTFPFIWVAGEVSDVTRPRSGHVYFTLKDSNSQIRAVMWRSTASRLRFELEDGTQVVCGAGIDVYAPRGSYQLVIRQIEPRGMGALQLALRQLQQRLAAEGLFDPAHQKPLPRFPRRIAVVTSPTGAAIRDFLEAIRRRWQGGEVLVIPVRVQGDGAADEIVGGIHTSNHLTPRPDVLVITRGGGSLEDLWCFNEECVVRAIFTSQIPVISAVGHEIDVTLSDLVADARALTPTAAAELMAPSTEELQATMRVIQRRLAASLRSRAVAARSQLTSLSGRRIFRRPLDRLHDLARRLDELEVRATRAIRVRHANGHGQLSGLAGRIESLSPLAVLSRGFSLTERTRAGELIQDAATVEVGERITTRLAQGRLISVVEAIPDDS